MFTVIEFRQNEEESSYDTKPVKSNFQNGHHNNPEFNKEQGKGRQNGYDNNDDRLVVFFIFCILFYCMSLKLIIIRWIRAGS